MPGGLNCSRTAVMAGILYAVKGLPGRQADRASLDFAHPDARALDVLQHRHRPALLLGGLPEETDEEGDEDAG